MRGEKILWRIVRAVDLICDARDKDPDDKEVFVRVDDGVMTIAARSYSRNEHGDRFWNFTLIENAPKRRAADRYAVVVESLAGQFSLRAFNYTAAKRLVNRVEGLVALELLAEQ